MTMAEDEFDTELCPICLESLPHCWDGMRLAHKASQLKESNVRPREIPAPKDSVFLADMRSRQESSKALREPGTNFLEGVKNDLRSTENSQNESHSQNHLGRKVGLTTERATFRRRGRDISRSCPSIQLMESNLINLKVRD